MSNSSSTPSLPTRISPLGIVGIALLALGLLTLAFGYIVAYLIPPLLSAAIALIGMVVSIVAVVTEGSRSGRAGFGPLQIAGIILFVLGLASLLLGFSYLIALIAVVFMAIGGLLANIRKPGLAAAVVPAAPLSDRTSTLAVVALVLAFFASVPAVICGHLALAEVARTGERGRGLAIAALWIGYVSIVISIIVGVVYLVVILGR